MISKKVFKSNIETLKLFMTGEGREAFTGNAHVSP